MFVTIVGAILENVTYEGDAESRLLGFGTINDSIANAGTIEAQGGLLDINGLIAGTGKLVIDAAATLELSGQTAESVDFNGVSTLKLDTPTGYTGTLNGLAYGDVIEIASTTVSSATLSGADLLVTLSGGTKLDYALAGPLADGAVTISSDGGTGSDITFYHGAASSAVSVGDFSTMHFIAPAGNDRNAGPGALASDSVFADSFKSALGGRKGLLSKFPTVAIGSGFFADTFSSADGLYALISQREPPALLAPHYP